MSIMKIPSLYSVHAYKQSIKSFKNEKERTY